MKKADEVLFLENLIILEYQYSSVVESISDHDLLCHKILEYKLPNAMTVDEMAKCYVNDVSFVFLNNYDKLMYLFSKCIPKLLQEYRYDLLQMVVEKEKNNMKKEDSFAFKNLKGINRILMKFGNNCGVKTIEYESMSINKVKRLAILYFNYIDPSFRLTNIFLEGIKKGEICLWDVYDDEVSDQVLANCSIDTIFSFETSLMNNNLFLNAPCEGNMLDLYCLVHEFFHYLTFLDREVNVISSCESFFTEVASVFHEKYLGQFLKMIAYPSETIDSILDFRENANNRSKPLICSLYSLMELENIDNNVMRQLDVMKYMDFYKIDNYDDASDFLLCNLVISDGAFFSGYRYMIADYIANSLLNKINNGNKHIVMKVLAMTSILKNELNPMNIIDFLECRDLFEDFSDDECLINKNNCLSKVKKD